MRYGFHNVRFIYTNCNQFCAVNCHTFGAAVKYRGGVLRFLATKVRGARGRIARRDGKDATRNAYPTRKPAC